MEKKIFNKWFYTSAIVLIGSTFFSESNPTAQESLALVGTLGAMVSMGYGFASKSKNEE